MSDEPFVRATENGKFIRLRMVTVENVYIHKLDRTKRHTEWHTLNFWGALSEIVDREIRIGSPIRIEGALRTRSWDDKDGVNQKRTEISVSKMDILDVIVGCEPPAFIMDVTKNKDKKVKTEPIEIKRPADDPDNLPF